MLQSPPCIRAPIRMEASLDIDSAPETGEETDAFLLKRRREAWRATRK